MYIGIDFDGTVVKHKYPIIGEDIGAVPILKELTNNGHRLILNTMRSGKELDEAVNWFKENNIELFGINNNPTQYTWTSSPKVYAHIYIDDAALGCPCKFDEVSHRKYVDWEKIKTFFKENGVL